MTPGIRFASLCTSLNDRPGADATSLRPAAGSDFSARPTAPAWRAERVPATSASFVAGASATASANPNSLIASPRPIPHTFAIQCAALRCPPRDHNDDSATRPAAKAFPASATREIWSHTATTSAASRAGNWPGSSPANSSRNDASSATSGRTATPTLSSPPLPLDTMNSPYAGGVTGP